MTIYALCTRCDHFVDANFFPDGVPEGVAPFVHLCDEEHHNPDDHHEAKPRGQGKTIDEWKADRPDLFITHADDLIGPNSAYHVTQLPTPPNWDSEED